MASAKVLGYAFGLVVLALSFHKGAPVAQDKAAEQTLTYQEEKDRVVLAWSGPIAEPMRDEFAAVVEQFKGDPRRFVLSLNSPGGSVQQGREVVAAMREAAKTREIDTVVAAGGVCASMCVPIYLIGQNRAAHPSAHFMFHEASLDPTAVKTSELNANLRKTLEAGFTDMLFETDFAAPRVNPRWLARMRGEIAGRDIWKNGRQLVDEGSGVIDALTAAAP